MTLPEDIIQVLREKEKISLVTTTKGLTVTTDIIHFTEDDGKIYFIGMFPEPHMRHIHLNQYVEIILDNTNTKYSLYGTAFFVNDKKITEKVLKSSLAKGAELPPNVDLLPPIAKLVCIKVYEIEKKNMGTPGIEKMEISENKPSLLKGTYSAFINELKYWVFATRAPFFTASIIPILVGTFAGYFVTGRVKWGLFGWALLGLILIHAATNLFNDYYDHVSKNDEVNRFFTQFNGGSRFIQARLATPTRIFVAGIVTLVLGVIIGLYLNTIYSGNVILYIGVIGVFLAVFYTAPPFRFSYRTLGDVAVGLGFGPLPVIGAYYLQTGNLSWGYSKYAIIASLPVGVLVALILYVNSFQDMEADAAVNKKTSIVKLGKSKAAKLYPWLLSTVYLIILIGVVIKWLPLPVILGLLTIPMAIKAVKGMQTMYSKIFELIPVNITTINLHLFTGLLIALGFIIAKLFNIGFLW